MPPKAAGRSDIFQTEPIDVRFMSQYIPKEWKLWECASGERQMVETLREDGFDVISTDKLSGEGSGSWFYAAWFCKDIPFPESNKIGSIYKGDS